MKDNVLYHYSEKGTDMFDFMVANHIDVTTEFVRTLEFERKRDPTFKPGLNIWELQVRNWLMQSFFALEKMHTFARVAHRDFKMENLILVDGNLKIIDFGMMRYYPPYGDFCTTQFVGTLSYMSPECYYHTNPTNGINIQTDSYDARLNDIYSLGCVLFLWLFCAPIYDKKGPVLSDPRFLYSTNQAYLVTPRKSNATMRGLLQRYKLNHKTMKGIQQSNISFSEFASDDITSLMMKMLKPEKNRWNLRMLYKHLNCM